MMGEGAHTLPSPTREKTTTKGWYKLYKLLADVTVVRMSGEGASTLASPTYKTTTENGYNQRCTDYADNRSSGQHW